MQRVVSFVSKETYENSEFPKEIQIKLCKVGTHIELCIVTCDFDDDPSNLGTLLINIGENL